MTNFLAETVDAVANSGHKPDDIIFIGSKETGHQCTWEEFCKLSDIEYSSGYGAQEIASDLIVVFADGSSMWRGEYDGSEWWDFAVPFAAPEQRKEIKALKVSGTMVGWVTLAELND